MGGVGGYVGMPLGGRGVGDAAPHIYIYIYVRRTFLYNVMIPLCFNYSNPQVWID